MRKGQNLVNYGEHSFPSHPASNVISAGLDNLVLRWDREDVVNLRIGSLTDITITSNLKDGTERHKRGRLRNLVVNIYPTAIILSGSPATFMYGENIKLLGYRDLEKFFAEIADTTGLNVNNAQIISLDFAANLPVFLEPRAYFNYWLPSGWYSSNNSHDNTQYVQTQSKSRVFAIYDKSYQSKIAGNLLRLELRIKKRLRNKLKKNRKNMSPLYVPEFCTPECYCTVIDIWKKYLTKFLLTEIEDCERIAVRSITGLKKYALLRLLADRDEVGRLNEAISKSHRTKKIPSKQYAAIRKILRQVPNDEFKEHLREQIGNASSQAAIEAIRASLDSFK